MHDTSSVVSIHISSSTEEDIGVGIVVRKRPLTLLVPAHLATLLELERAESITIDGESVDLPSILTPPGFSDDSILLLEFKSVPSTLALHTIAISGRQPELTPSDKVSILSPTLSSSSADGLDILESDEKAGERTLIIDFDTEPGMSGSPILYKGKLHAVCQGMTAQHRAIAIPLSNASLRTLRARTNRRKLVLAGSLFISLVFLLTLFSTSANDLLGQSKINEVKLDNSSKTAVIYAEHGPLLSYPRRHGYMSRITSTAIAKDNKGDSYAVIGTDYSEAQNGEVSLLDSRGRELWNYKIGPTDCCYNTPFRSFSDFEVTKVAAYDLNNDAQDEIVVTMQGHHWYPSALTVLDLKGNVIAQYWHPGFILDFAIGHVGQTSNPLVVVTAINNDLYASHCKAVFAFNGLNIAGEAPPYYGSIKQGTQLWYAVIQPLSQESGIEISDLIDIIDQNGDGKNEILVETKGGQFYCLDDLGNVLSVGLADAHTALDVPSLISIAP